MNQYHLRKAHQILQRGVREHFVYFALASGSERFVKIGTSYDPNQRISALRNGGTLEPDEIRENRSSFALSLIGYVQGDGELERHLHRAFADYRCAGEWFAYEPIATEIDDMLAHHCECRSCIRQRA
jgi:hypothetical protein